LDIENFFDILKDDEWHNIPELADQIEIQANKLTEFFQFLSKQGIIEYEEKTQRIKIKPEWKELLPE
jgi:predicted transcriptional regulator